MPSTHHDRRAAEKQAVMQLAERFTAAVPAGLQESTVFSAAIAFICAHAEPSEKKGAVAALMHAAADELTKGGAAFGATTH